MTRFIERLKQLERRRNPAPPRLIMVWGDDDIVTDDNGQQVTAAEWTRRHPNGRIIQMTWGDEPNNRLDNLDEV